MEWNPVFIINSLLLGLGLAMDAFSVSLANGLNEPFMSRRKALLVSGVFAAFQAAMPITGWICVHTFVKYFTAFEKFIPWIALILLCFIGGKMIYEGLGGTASEAGSSSVGFAALMLQGVATSIDALSVGFTIANYNYISAVSCALIIAAVTFAVCTAGIAIGKKFGTRLAGRASVFGGAILICIGLEIFISSFF